MIFNLLLLFLFLHFLELAEFLPELDSSVAHSSIPASPSMRTTINTARSAARFIR